MCIFQRFGLSFGNREDDELGPFAEVKQGRANQVAHILYKEQTTFLQSELINSPT